MLTPEQISSTAGRLITQFQPSGPSDARIMIVGEAPGEREVYRGLPFVGPSGEELDKMLQEAGILRTSCFATNICRIRPRDNDISLFFSPNKTQPGPNWHMFKGRWVTHEIVAGYAQLLKEINLVRPNVIIAAGNLALFALTGELGVTKWRGSQMRADFQVQENPNAAHNQCAYYPKVIPTIHPAAILRDRSQRPAVVRDLKRAEDASHNCEYSPPVYDFTVRPSFRVALDRLQWLWSECESQRATGGEFKLSVDIETRAGHIACIGFAWSAREAICIPLMCVEDKSGYWTVAEEGILVWHMCRLMAHPAVAIVGQNFLYDIQYIYRHWHCIPRVKQDTMISQHVLYPGMRKGLDFLSSMYAEFHLYWKEEGKNWDPTKDEDEYWAYNCKDAVITYEVADNLLAMIEHDKMQGPHAFLQSLFWRVFRCVERGLAVDHALKKALPGDLIMESTNRQEFLDEILGHPININSPAQLKKLFYEDLQQTPIRKKGPKGPIVTCDDDALKRLGKREPLLLPITRTIAEMRSIKKSLDFANVRLDYDDRLRCTFDVTGTETFRFASRENAFGTGTNLQNVSSGGTIRDEDTGDVLLVLPNLRRIVVPDEGMELFDIDLASADFRIVTWEADEPELKAMFAAGLDPYTEIAKEYYHDSSLTKKDERRGRFKMLAHGTNYLGKPQTLSRNTGLGVHEIERTQKWYFGKFPGIKRWHERLVSQLLHTRTVHNAFGFRRIYFDRIEGNLFNQGVAWIPQSTVAIIIDTAWGVIEDTIGEAQILLQVHDSLVGQVPKGRPDLIEAVRKAAEIVVPYADPLIIPTGVKTSLTSWGDAE